MRKIMWFGDAGSESGFGRIANEISKRLKMRGHQVMGAGIMYGGWPHTYNYDWLFPLASKDIWNEITMIVNNMQPDIVICCQDFPYAQTLYKACRIDWSRRALLTITPIDGTPIDARWLDLVDELDGTMVISRFGVEAMRQAGRRVGLCHPGVDITTFKPADAEEKMVLREKAGIAPDAFVIGMFAMNQGRKNIPATIEAFAEFAKDKPHARLLLDMDKESPGGWNIPDQLMKPVGLDEKFVIFREDLIKRGLNNLRDRYCLLDVHSVISRREGFGLPLLESQACGVCALALDWCSGTEICGDDKGILIPPMPRAIYGTWGGAQDKEPDMQAFIAALNALHDNPGRRAYLAENGYKWATQQTWDKTADSVNEWIEIALEHHKGQWSNVDATVNNNSRIQPAAALVEMPQQPVRDGHAERDGDHTGGRCEHGLQPIGVDGRAIEGQTQREEFGVRSDVQRRLDDDNWNLPDVPELRHGSENGGLAATDDANIPRPS